jgi:predicted house-cleaning noncanonical NTP pyrophosphatase (MazG superfamily)
MITFKCDKLVRDNTLQRFKDADVTAQHKIISNKDLIDALNCKLIEEAYEVQDAKNRQEIVEELADLFEVIDGLCKGHGILLEDIIAEKKTKIAERGRFDQGIYIDTIQMQKDNPKAAYFRAAPEKYPEV